MKKSFMVVTTSKKLHEGLHNKKCVGNHEHQIIEGSVNINATRMNRSQYSENYPRKFARTRSVCQIFLNRGLHDAPYSLKEKIAKLNAVFAADDEPPAKTPIGVKPLFEQH